MAVLEEQERQSNVAMAKQQERVRQEQDRHQQVLAILQLGELGEEIKPEVSQT